MRAAGEEEGINARGIALFSVTEKEGVEKVARAACAAGLEILSTGGTARHLRNHGIEVKEAGEYSGAGEILSGRVKTLAPRIHAGLLGRWDEEKDRHDMKRLGALPIRLLVCNLYHLEGVSPESVEGIDIGGVAMLRAAAKNWKYVAVVTDPEDYEETVAVLESEARNASLAGALGTEEWRRRLALRAWRLVRDYDERIASAFAPEEEEGPAALSLLERGRGTLFLEQVMPLRYGENPHQRAGWFRTAKRGVHEIEILDGKTISYNNLLDMTAAMNLALDLGKDAVAVIKHQTPCGAAVGGTISENLAAAIATDRESAFGSVIAVNGAVDEEAFAAMKGLFVEVLFVRGLSSGARSLLGKRKKMRAVIWENPLSDGLVIRNVPGGLLIQRSDEEEEETCGLKNWRVVTKREPTEEEKRDLRIAELIAKHARSNAVALVKNGTAVGIGSGRTSRVKAVRDAVSIAGDRLPGTVMGSDAFFPFPDGLEEAKGITAVIQPGGSIRDEEVIAYADAAGLAMVFTDRRHFRH
ncbi:MAG: bifunctional phosphoribosylaminoimidazolecarboxamide formyltransferase/IMP cyclohydrolase PurH [Candidatus Hydrogenedentota bacterium]|nr:MAG: bifunctional phosphoribosylaminoimidazolecarboxamide formyltransferase/IMP cyclohydrolase PurH [Candidatus Hydrogenedentota bacterium]